MKSLVFKVKKESLRPEKITVSFDADKFEKVAANFGMFGEEFLESLDRAEKDIKAGRVKKIRSLASLRK